MRVLVVVVGAHWIVGIARALHCLLLGKDAGYGVLLAAVRAHPAIQVRLGTQVTWASPDGTVRTTHQGVEAASTADLVVGADGPSSTVRAHGDFGAVARATGACYVRALVPGASYELGWGEYWTPLGLFGGAPLGDGSTYLYLDAAWKPAPPIATTAGQFTFADLLRYARATGDP